MRAVLISLVLLSTSLPAMAFGDRGCKVTLAQFSALKLRSNVGHVYNTLGCRGTIISENHFGNTKTRLEQWEGADPNSLVHVTISDGWFVSKSQFGLK